MKQSIITAFLGRTQDRFSEYQEPTTLEQRLDLVVKIPGVVGLKLFIRMKLKKRLQPKSYSMTVD